MVRLNLSKPDKLVEELYYLPHDIGEKHNLIKNNRSKAEELKKLANKAHTNSPKFNW